MEHSALCLILIPSPCLHLETLPVPPGLCLHTETMGLEANASTSLLFSVETIGSVPNTGTKLSLCLQVETFGLVVGANTKFVFKEKEYSSVVSTTQKAMG